MPRFRKSLIFVAIFILASCAQKELYPDMVPAEQPRPIVAQNIEGFYKPSPERKTLDIENITAISEEQNNVSVFDKIMAKLQTFTPPSVEVPSSPTSSEALRVGMLLPLTGKASATGEALQNAAMLALLETGDKDMILQFYDTKGTVEGADEAALEALEQGAKLLIGPLFSYEVEKVAKRAESYNVNVITFSSDPSVVGDNVYSIALLLPQQVEQIVRYACEKGYKNFAILAQSNEKGEFAYSGAKQAAEMCGAGITRAGFYDPASTDFSAAVKEILPEALLRKIEKENLKEQGYEVVEEPMYDDDGNLIDENNIVFDFDAILIADEGVRLRSLGALLAFYDITPDKFKMLGISLWDDANVKKESALVGGWYTTLPKDGFRQFSDRYKAVYGTKRKIPRIASQAYDAVALVSSLAKGGEVSARTITEPSGFLGVDGLFRLLPDGSSERSLAIMQVSRKGADKQIKPAEKVFVLPPSDKVSLRSVSLDAPVGDNLPVLENPNLQEGENLKESLQDNFLEKTLKSPEVIPAWGVNKE